MNGRPCAVDINFTYYSEKSGKQSPEDKTDKNDLKLCFSAVAG